MNAQYNLPKRRSYEHPGRLFIEKFGPPQERHALDAYAAFLRKEAYVGENGRVRMRSIRWRFGVRLVPKELPDDTPGFTDPELGLIFVNKRDSLSRQRFTEAHEFVELLYIASKESPGWPGSIFDVGTREKEKLCQEGAGTILMPREATLRLMDQREPGLDLASSIAEFFDTSLTAAAYRMVELSSDECCLSVWQIRPTIRLEWLICSTTAKIKANDIADVSESAIRKAIAMAGRHCNDEVSFVDKSSKRWCVEARKVTYPKSPQIIAVFRRA